MFTMQMPWLKTGSAVEQGSLLQTHKTLTASEPLPLKQQINK